MTAIVKDDGIGERYLAHVAVLATERQYGVAHEWRGDEPVRGADGGGVLTQRAADRKLLATHAVNTGATVQ